MLLLTMLLLTKARRLGVEQAPASHLIAYPLQPRWKSAVSNFNRAARPSRLPTPRQIPYLFLFVAEHDDYHPARIAALARQLAAA